jgi:endonuclease/exonuclease/phosphatase family metal-dependent hydrolase
MTGIGAKTDVSFLTANAMLWDQMGNQPTALNFDDDVRTDRIGAVIAQEDPDVVGLTEVWSSERADRLTRILQATERPLSHVVTGPFGLGLGGIAKELEAVHPRLAELGRNHVDRIIYTAFREDNATLGIDDTDEVLAAGILRSLAALPFTLHDQVWDRLKELVNRAIQAFLHGQKVFGSGLQLGSRHPILDEEFIPHPATGGVEGYSQKGVRRARISLHGEKPTTVLLTHLIHGESRQARGVRAKQLAQLADIVRATEGPLILQGDLNVRGDSKDWIAMLELLGLNDAFREVHPDAEGNPGPTYLGNNEFARRLGMRGVDTNARLDYILYRPGMGLIPRAARVLNEGFELPDPPPGIRVRTLSDHRPVRIDFAVQPA